MRCLPLHGTPPRGDAVRHDDLRMSCLPMRGTADLRESCVTHPDVTTCA